MKARPVGPGQPSPLPGGPFSPSCSAEAGVESAGDLPHLKSWPGGTKPHREGDLWPGPGATGLAVPVVSRVWLLVSYN